MYITLESSACGGITSSAIDLIGYDKKVVFINRDGDAQAAINRSWGTLDPRRANISFYTQIKSDNEFLGIIDYVVKNIDEVDILIVDSINTIASPLVRTAVEKQLREVFTFNRGKKAIVGKYLSPTLNLQVVGRVIPNRTAV